MSCFRSPALRRVLLSSCIGSAMPSGSTALAQQVAAPFADAFRKAAAAEAAVTLSVTSVSDSGLPAPIAATGSRVTVLTDRVREERRRRTALDALQQGPGLDLVQTGGQTSLFLRGANTNQTKVLSDGIDATDPSDANGAFEFGHLLTDDLARIQVLREPQSGLFVRVDNPLDRRLENSTGYLGPSLAAYGSVRLTAV